MHDTLHSDIKAYIDEKTEFNNNVFIRGWAFHQRHGVLPIRLIYNGIQIESEVMTRVDVCDFYKRHDITLCGWRVKMPMNANGTLSMNVNNTWVPFFNLSTKDAKKSSIEIINGDEDMPKEVVTKSVNEINKVLQNDSTIKEINMEELKQLLSQQNMEIVDSCDISLTTDLNPPRFVVVDNFYKNPDSIRKFALNLDFKEHKAYHKGKRTDDCFRFPGLKEAFEEVLGTKIVNWEKYGTNGCFQYCIGGDQLVYHCDGQQYAGLIYLSPDAPPQTGTSFYRSKYTKKMKAPEGEHDIVFKNGYLDPTEFELVDTVGNVYNRLVLFDAKLIHSASEYFGTNIQNGRLFQLFFFDIEGYDRVN